MKGFKIAEYGGDVNDIKNRAGRSLFKRVTLQWSRPQIINGYDTPFFEDNRPLLYIIIRNHHRMNRRDRIQYIGLSINPNNRFQNHPTAQALAEKRGETSLSYAYLDQGRSSNRIETIKGTLEEIEHILIWTLWSTQELANDRKLFTLPGMGRHPGSAWHILNEGYRFSGQMPREIVYPWILQKNGRDRSFLGRSRSTADNPGC